MPRVLVNVMSSERSDRASGQITSSVQIDRPVLGLSCFSIVMMKFVACSAFDVGFNSWTAASGSRADWARPHSRTLRRLPGLMLLGKTNRAISVHDAFNERLANFESIEDHAQPDRRTVADIR